MDAETGDSGKPGGQGPLGVPKFVWVLLAVPIVCFGGLLVVRGIMAKLDRKGRTHTNSLGMKFVRLEPGEFWMGSPETEEGWSGDETRHRVRLTKRFLLGVHEVTTGQFGRFTRESGYRTDAEKEGWAYGWEGKDWGKVDGASWRKPGFEQGEDHPAVCVSWNDASAFCEWLSRKEGRKYRLPTEAEWEYACRAGTETAYQWGDDPDQGEGWCNGLDATAKEKWPGWPAFKWRDGYTFTSPVGRFRANAWGLFDMHGDAWEWCGDWYGDYAAGEVADPVGPLTGTARVLRGGSWINNPWILRSAFRGRGTPVDRSHFFGFRSAMDF